MKKKLIIISIALIILLSVGGFVIINLFKYPSEDDQRKIAQLIPPPTRPLAQASADKNVSSMKKLSFPLFRTSMMVPANLKNHKEVDPKAEGTELGSNYVALYTPDSLFDLKKHTQSVGIKLSINITDNKKDFTDEKELVPTSSLQDTTEDSSIIPDKNPLLTKDTVKAYSFPTTNTWTYNAEALLRNGGNMLTVTLGCYDYTATKNSPACKKLITNILTTLKH